MKKYALISAVVLTVVVGPAFAEPLGYPVGGFGDAWFQDQPSSIGINNGYDPQTQTYLVPANPPYTVPANPNFQGRSTVTPR